VEFISPDGNYTRVIKTVTITVLAVQTPPPAPGLTFRGFFLPVRNLPVRNRVKAGLAVPVKFSISGSHRLSGLQAGSPSSRNVPCVAGAHERSVEQTVEARRSQLDYSRRSGQYRYVWKTSTSWAGTCRVLEVKLIDGTTHEALFHFPKKQRDRGDDRNHRNDRDDDRDRGGYRERNDDD
jgi:hypothetical protein